MSAPGLREQPSTRGLRDCGNSYSIWRPWKRGTGAAIERRILSVPVLRSLANYFESNLEEISTSKFLID